MTATSKWPSPWRPGRGDSVPVRYDGPVALLVAVLRGRESLPGALCVGQAPAFDLDAHEGEDEAAHADRLAAAVSVCRRCVERQACPAPVPPPPSVR